MKPLSRIEFKEQVFSRDNNKCVICGKPAVDAHHIIDRSLFADGGYYLDNGVSLCEDHHIDAETTKISCKELRDIIKVEKPIYPDVLNLNEFVFDYDKWGNPILKSGKRLRGKLFEEKKQLFSEDVLKLFEKDYEPIVEKYPRTYHMPFSPGTTSDDRKAKKIGSCLTGSRIITEKLDGENLCLSENGVFARSRVAPTQNPWAQWVKPKWVMIKSDLRDMNIEICGENMYGEHSIIYSGLNEHFYVFGIRNTKYDFWLSWEEVCELAYLFDFKTVPVLNSFNDNYIHTINEVENIINDHMNKSSLLSDDSLFISPKEGCVIRISDEIPCDMFYNYVFKYVREKHVKTDEFWAKNWRRSYLNSELKNMNRPISEIYSDHIKKGEFN